MLKNKWTKRYLPTYVDLWNIALGKTLPWTVLTLKSRFMVKLTTGNVKNTDDGGPYPLAGGVLCGGCW